MGILIQFLIYPYTAKRYGVLNCLLVASWSLPIVYFLIPFTALLPTESARQATAFVLMVAKLAGVVYAFPCLIILLTNSAPNLRVLGTLNGIATSVAGVGRAAGPMAIGSVFSFGVKQGYIIIPWFVLAFVCVLSAATPLWLVEPPGFATDSEEDQDQDQQRDDEEESQLQRNSSWEQGNESSSTCATSSTSQGKPQNSRRSMRTARKGHDSERERALARAYDADDSDTANLSGAASDASSIL